METIRLDRNDLCRCGSGKKYKKCCLAQQRTLAQPLGRVSLQSGGGSHPTAYGIPDYVVVKGEGHTHRSKLRPGDECQLKDGSWAIYRPDLMNGGSVQVKDRGWTPEGELKPGDQYQHNGVWVTFQPERVIGTTEEHPFYVHGRGWTPLREIRPGELIRTKDGWMPVNRIKDTGEWERVYNLRVTEYHTYFVGCEEWGFAVWAHNSYKDVIDPATGNVVKKAAQVQADVEAGLIAKGVDPALAKRITAEGAKPLADGNLLHELVQNGHITPANVVDLFSAPTGTGSATFANPQLQKKFKHAGDFGVTGPANKDNLAAYESSLNAHLANPDVVAVPGTYLNKPATIHVHPDTNLAVIVDGAGAFQTGMKLSPQQQIYGLILGRLGGH